MKVYHIIEQTADQQTVEVLATNAEKAILLYATRALVNEPITRVEWINNNTLCVYAGCEYCTAQIHDNGRLIFAKWTHTKGLY